MVSADSVQVYRGMDVGSAKPSVAERRGVPHHLIDVVDPGDVMTVGRYQDLARKAISEIHARKRLPIVSGGTGLYVRAALGEWEIPHIPPDPERRAALEDRARTEGVRALWEELRSLDPERAARIGPGDLPRIVRAFELGKVRGKQRKSPYRLWKVGLWRSREEIHRRIAERAVHLWEEGMVEETGRLLEMRLPLDRPPLSALGYREAAWYLSGRVTWDEGVALFLRNSRRFAKRQLTWWRREEGILWLRADEAAEWLSMGAKDFLRGMDPSAGVPKEILAPTPV